MVSTYEFNSKEPNINYYFNRFWQRQVKEYLHYTILFTHIPCKHAVMGQYRAATGPMLPAPVQYRLGNGM